jgi:2-oxoglutarate ferredoxin oxidoreductase subunit alpha
VGLLRPITLRPFPTEQLESLAPQVKGFLVVEMNTGQMLDDVLLATKGRVPVEFYGRLGGMVPFPDEILSEIQRMASGPLRIDNDPRRSWYKRFTYSKN